MLLKKNLLINAVTISRTIKIKIGKYISRSLIKSIQFIELFLLIKFPTPAPKEFTINIPGIKPSSVEKKYLLIFMPKITGKTFCNANGMPPPVNLNRVKYQKSFLLNKFINFSILEDNFFLIKSLKKKFAKQ